MIRALAHDQAADQRFLPRRERLLLARTAPALATGQGGLSALLEGLHPFADKAAVDPNRLGHLDPALAGADHVHGYPAQFGLGRGRKFAEVAFHRHGEAYRKSQSNDTYLNVGLVDLGTGDRHRGYAQHQWPNRTDGRCR